MKKRIFDTSFIVLTAAILVLLDIFGLLEKHIGFALIPIIIAFYIGQYSERTFQNKTKPKL